MDIEIGQDEKFILNCEQSYEENFGVPKSKVEVFDFGIPKFYFLHNFVKLTNFSTIFEAAQPKPITEIITLTH